MVPIHKHPAGCYRIHPTQHAVVITSPSPEPSIIANGHRSNNYQPSTVLRKRSVLIAQRLPSGGYQAFLGNAGN
jgi:hypothetical protein